MQTVIGVRFKKAGKIYYFSPGRLEVQKGDDVIVETSRGVEYGSIVVGPRDMEDGDVVSPLKVIQRKASEADRERVATNKEREKEAFVVCERKIADHGLPMKLVDVEYTFDLNKIVFYFTADGRIDFRELVKDLAAVFRTRIELRQIGVRDEAKLMGGIGCCGRPLCCATFLGDFEPVSIRMAKEQNLSLNPTKISGICGRLMCCLKYENDYYESECHRRVTVQEPKQGARVVSVEGEGKVISVNEQRRTATILLDDNKTIVASWEDIIEKDEESETLQAAAASMTQEDEAQGSGRQGRDFQPSGEGGAHRRSNRNDRIRGKNRKEAREPRNKERQESRERHDGKDSREGKENARGRDSKNRRNGYKENRESGGRSRDRRSRNQRDGRRNAGNDAANTHGGYGTPFAGAGADGAKGTE